MPLVSAASEREPATELELSRGIRNGIQPGNHAEGRAARIEAARTGWRLPEFRRVERVRRFGYKFPLHPLGDLQLLGQAEIKTMDRRRTQAGENDRPPARDECVRVVSERR